ncbi:MAG TPA: CPBP family intramembrane glutamic endopeptidase [Pirellulales bacterium]|nr:CPBP family intramembrane glutamic endopeptidase [Pirellulales bacterium]
MGGIILVAVLLSAAAWIALGLRRRARLPLVPLSPRRPVPWRGGDLLLVALFYVVAQSACWWMFSYLAGGDRGQPTASPVANESQLASSIAANLFSIGFALLWIHFQSGAGWHDFGWRRDTIRADLGLGLIAFAAVAPPIYGLQALLQSKFVREHLWKFVDPWQIVDEQHPIIEALQQQPSGLLYSLAGLSAVVVAPLAEEFFFRVLLQGWLESLRLPAELRVERPADDGHRPRPIAIVVTSLLFASMHIGHGAAPLPLFFLALALGYLYQRTHRLLPSVTVHFCLNACTFVMLCLGSPEAG